MASTSSPGPRVSWRPSPSTPPTPSKRVDDSQLFTTPNDLVCPITQQVFSDPVLTTTGHVYERAAIERHLLHSQSDPLTRQELVNKSLTPVFVLKSRAHEYREGAAKACVERACSTGCPDPVRYLRRAVELVADAGGKEGGMQGVRGLSQQTIEYVMSHPSNAYDRLALQVFAQGLFQAGYRDRAAAVYYHLLVSGSDRAQQAQLLRCCLACWVQGELPSAAGPSSPGAASRGSGDSEATSPRLLLLGPGEAAAAATEGAAAGSAGGASGTLAHASGGNGGEWPGGGGVAAEPHVFEKLVLLFEGQAMLGWGQIIDMAAEAGLGQEFVVQLCEQLLFRPMPVREGSDGALAQQQLIHSWTQEKEILMKYVRVLCQGVKDRCSENARRLDELEAWQQGEPLQRSSSAYLFGSFSGRQGHNQGQVQAQHGRRGPPGAAGRGSRRGGGHGPQAPLCRPAWLGHPIVVGGCLLVACLAEPYSVAGRLVGAVPLLALLPPPPQ